MRYSPNLTSSKFLTLVKVACSVSAEGAAAFAPSGAGDEENDCLVGVDNGYESVSLHSSSQKSDDPL